MELKAIISVSASVVACLRIHYMELKGRRAGRREGQGEDLNPLHGVERIYLRDRSGWLVSLHRIHYMELKVFGFASTNTLSLEPS